MRAGLDTLRQAWPGSTGALPDAVALDARYRYLRVQVEGRTGLMVLADHDPGPQGRTAVWYSADGVVLRLAEGRIAGVTDGVRSWQWVSAAAPIDWQAVVTRGPTRFEQIIDRQPGWRFGERRARVVQAMASAPALHRAVGLPPQVQWFEERNASGAPQPVWYAVVLSAEGAQVMYGQTCLETDWCLSWQPWPAAAEAGRGGRLAAVP
jgi:hypothetical protein